MDANSTIGFLDLPEDCLNMILSFAKINTLVLPCTSQSMHNLVSTSRVFLETAAIWRLQREIFLGEHQHRSSWWWSSRRTTCRWEIAKHLSSVHIDDYGMANYAIFGFAPELAELNNLPVLRALVAKGLTIKKNSYRYYELFNASEESRELLNKLLI